MLGVLEDAIKLRWNLVDINDKYSLRNFLISILLKCIENENDSSNTRNHFLNKLNNIIVLVNKYLDIIKISLISYDK